MAYSLLARPRSERGRKNQSIRTHGMIPAVVYGAHTEPQSVTLDRQQFIKTYGQVGESTIVELQIGKSEPLHVLIQDLQLDPVRHEVAHVDFRSLDMKKAIEAKVDLLFVGESPAVKNLGGVFVPSRDHVMVRCLPIHLPHHLEVDLSRLQTFDDSMHVKDLVVPEHVAILDEPSLTIAVVTPPRSEEELAELEKAVDVDVSAVEVEKKGKEEEEEETAETPLEESKT